MNFNELPEREGVGTSGGRPGDDTNGGIGAWPAPWADWLGEIESPFPDPDEDRHQRRLFEGGP